MAGYCLPKFAKEAFLKAIQSGEVKPAELEGMKTEDRRAFFADIVGKDNAKDLNTLFESKMILKYRSEGYATWARTALGEQGSKEPISRLEKMQELLNPADEKAFKQDLIDKKLGVQLTYEETKNIGERVAKLQSLSAAKDEFGNHTREYFKALDETKRYVQSINEGSIYQHLVSIARNVLLATVKTPIKVFTEQTLLRGSEKIIKDVVYGGEHGANPDLAAKYARNALATYNKTGFNLGSMNSLDEGNMFGDSFRHNEGLSAGVRGVIRAG